MAWNMGQSAPSYVWRRERASIATIYSTIPARFTIIWDPQGWHLWANNVVRPSTLIGVYPTLDAAKKRAQEVS